VVVATFCFEPIPQENRNTHSSTSHVPASTKMMGLLWFNTRIQAVNSARLQLNMPTLTSS